MSAADWERTSTAALALFAYGQQEAAKRGLLLVDTKYELGKDAEGNILLLDEVCGVFGGGGATRVWRGGGTVWGTAGGIWGGGDMDGGRL